MSARNRTSAPADLLERDLEIAHITAALASAAAGRGAMVVIEGRAGAGKSALLEVVEARAIASGADVRVARATELEGDFAFGGARQLLAASREPASLDGAAVVAAPVLAASDDALAPPPAFAVLNGLTTYLEALAAGTAVVLLIDDAHWLDAPTVRWLDHLRGRLHEMRVLVVLTVREAVARQLDNPLHSLLGDPRLEHWSLAPLSETAVAMLLTERLGAAPAPALVVGCHEATAGNPFAVCELVASLELDGGGLADTGARLTRRVPGTIARSIRARLARLDPDAARVARALAVLGDGASLHRVATLAQLPGERTGLMVDQLASAELVAAARPLAFVHPLVRSAIEDDLELGRRSALHAAAARQLTQEGADPEAIAAHLLRCDPMGKAETMTSLRAAGARMSNSARPSSWRTATRSSRGGGSASARRR
jgi:predicted ATPase